MTVILEGREPCPVCGWQVTWMFTSTIRINKHSIRSTGGKSIVVQLHHSCLECGTPLRSDSGPHRWYFTPRDRAAIDDYRRARGWL